MHSPEHYAYSNVYDPHAYDYRQYYYPAHGFDYEHYRDIAHGYDPEDPLEHKLAMAHERRAEVVG